MPCKRLTTSQRIIRPRRHPFELISGSKIAMFALHYWPSSRMRVSVQDYLLDPATKLPDDRYEGPRARCSSYNSDGRSSRKCNRSRPVFKQILLAQAVPQAQLQFGSPINGICLHSNCFCWHSSFSCEVPSDTGPHSALFISISL